MKKQETFKVFVTKYALTAGITEHEVEQPSCCPNMVSEVNVQWPTNFHGENKEWHRTREGAVKKAEEMRKKKLESLKKSIKKFEKLKF